MVKRTQFLFYSDPPSLPISGRLCTVRYCSPVPLLLISAPECIYILYIYIQTHTHIYTLPLMPTVRQIVFFSIIFLPIFQALPPTIRNNTGKTNSVANFSIRIYNFYPTREERKRLLLGCRGIVREIIAEQCSKSIWECLLKFRDVYCIMKCV